MTKRIIVFSPHPDDGVLGCGGTIANRVREGCEVLMVILTDGRYAFSSVLGIESDPSPDEMKDIRREEAKRASMVLGLSEDDLLFLDYEDGTLEKSEREVQEKVAGVLREYSPAEVYFPHKTEFHKDHLVTNRIVARLNRELGIGAIEYKYTVTPKYARVGPLMYGFLSTLRQDIVCFDISKVLPLKEKAIRELRSKTSILSNRQKKPLSSRVGEFLKNEERFFINK